MVRCSIFGGRAIIPYSIRASAKPLLLRQMLPLAFKVRGIFVDRTLLVVSDVASVFGQGGARQFFQERCLLKRDLTNAQRFPASNL
jgi:hypothetical protein